jgi:hypothetical protein
MPSCLCFHCVFPVRLQSLHSGLVYYVRMYAVNAIGRSDAVVAEVDGSPGTFAFTASP